MFILTQDERILINMEHIREVFVATYDDYSDTKYAHIKARYSNGDLVILGMYSIKDKAFKAFKQLQNAMLLNTAIYRISQEDEA